MIDLMEKVALVTGASGGLGGAMAKSLHQQGAHVVLNGRREGALTDLADELGGRTSIVVGDLNTADGPTEIARQAAKDAGSIDILINNAGLTRDTLALRMGDDDWQTVLDVNLTAAFKLTKACLRGMMKSRWGRIINITSIVGVTGNPGQANYAASKAGLIGMTKSLAQEVASRNITANCVAPGFIKTEMTDELNDAQRSSLMDNIPAGRLGQPGDIAGVVSFLASDTASYITGQTIHVNGGMAMI